jgi:hypothetical protein
MKTYLTTIVLLITMALGACNNPQENQMDEKEDSGIRPERDYGSSQGDTTRTDEVNATGNANSGPVEGP